MSDELIEFWGLPSNVREQVKEEMLDIHRKNVQTKIRAGLTHVGESRRACMKTSERRFQVCQRCMHTPYCSQECQKLDWPEHKLVCTRIPVSFQTTLYVLFVNAIFQDVLRFAFIHKFKLLERRLPRYSKGYNSADKRPSAPSPMILDCDLVFEPTTVGGKSDALPKSGKVEVVAQLRHLYFPPPHPIPLFRHDQCVELLATSCRQTGARKPTCLNEKPDSVAFVGLIYVHLGSNSQFATFPFPILKSALDEYEIGLGGSTTCIVLTDDVPQTCSAKDSEKFINRVFREDHDDKFSLRRKFPCEAIQELIASQAENYRNREEAITEEFKESEKEMKMQLLGARWSQRSFIGEEP